VEVNVLIDFETLANTFRHFAETECRGSSALYEHLALSTAEDEKLLALAAYSSQGQPVPNLFFAAVHYLLLQKPSGPLAQFYPSLTDNAYAPDSAYSAFREFCLRNADALTYLLMTRRVQTNEVRRSTYLFLVFSIISRLIDPRPLALIEIGTSAGLNLLCDKYQYRYGAYGPFGDRQSVVQLQCTFRGSKQPALPQRIPNVVHRTGLDLNPIDVKDDDQVLWLHALVWPDQIERAELLRRAIGIAKRYPVKLIAGDGIELLPETVQVVPDDAVICVFHTHTINQFSLAERERLSTLLTELAATKERFFRVSIEGIGSPYPRLELTIWQDGHAASWVLAYCDSHGRWIEWLSDIN
jgi:hypothetical protein